GDAMFARWCRLVERVDLLEDPRFASDQRRGDNGAELSALMAGWCGGRGSGEALAALEAAGIPACRQLELAEVLTAPEVADGGFFAWQSQAGLDYPVVLPVRMAGLEPLRPAPRAGQHSREILARLGYDAAAVDRLIAAGVV